MIAKRWSKILGLCFVAGTGAIGCASEPDEDVAEEGAAAVSAEDNAGICGDNKWLAQYETESALEETTEEYRKGLLRGACNTASERVRRDCRASAKVCTARIVDQPETTESYCTHRELGGWWCSCFVRVECTYSVL